MKLLGTVSVHLNVIDQVTTHLIFQIRQILEEKSEYNGMVPWLFLDYQKACDSDVLFHILTEFDICTKPVMLIKMC
jgi:hypothetical protein